MEDRAFLPVLRFAVCSDLHIKEENDEHVRRLRTLMRTVYALAARDETYKDVDAFLFAGDLTNGGTPAQFRAFWDAVQAELQSGTKIISVIAKNHDNWEKGRNAEKTGLRHYREITGLSADTHITLGGLHFIGISTCEKKGRYYSRRQKRRLKTALKQAAKANPNAPIFVMQHEHVRETVYGSSSFDGWGNAWFKRIFQRFPQIVHFSGHSHYPLNDPRSVTQIDFTAVGTGALSYAEFTVGNERTVHPAQCETIAQGWVVEVDAANRVRLQGYDFLSGALLCSYVIAPPFDKAHFTLSPALQKARSSAPRFFENAALAIEKSEGGLNVTVPAASSTDGFPVFLYRAKALDQNGKALAEAWVLHESWFRSEKTAYTLTLPLTEGAAAVAVTAENAYGMASSPLTKEVP